VTGASKGIGGGIATALGAAGARVAVNYSSDREGAERVARAITDDGGEAIAVGADVSKAAGVARLFKEVDSAFGRLDVLVNNAGVFRFGAFAEITELGRIPEHLLVVGGGYVGVEMSQAMRRFGSKVTMIDRNGRLLSKEDPDVCEALRSLLADEGIDILLNARIKQVSGKCGDSVSVVVEQNGIEKVLNGSHVLVATGRNPNTEGLGLELAGVELTDRGYIKVNERLQTTAPGVWAIGEVAGSPQFTHISVDDFRVVHANLTGGNHVTTGRQVPYCLFTDPELARIGLSEREAEARGTAYRLFKVPMETNLRARTLSETRGFVKALVEAERDRILGFTAFGVGAGEILSAVQIAMIAGLPYTALRDAVLTHPTLVEGLIPLFSSAASAHNVVETRGTQISVA
jgi:pyruvate/2-oxoglutarate dehydrogenase complex dihydrolipoamide dehydrogenase (E3) component